MEEGNLDEAALKMRTKKQRKRGAARDGVAAAVAMAKDSDAEDEEEEEEEEPKKVEERKVDISFYSVYLPFWPFLCPPSFPVSSR